MKKNIVIIQGHPNADGKRFCHKLAEAYVNGAKASGHQVDVIEIAKLDFGLLRSRESWEQEGDASEDIKQAQALISQAVHVVFIYPLWLGTMPALVKGFLEQVFRPGFALSYADAKAMPIKLLKGKSARVVVTMGMPAFVYRYFFGAHSLKSLKRNILGFCGFSPVRCSLVGMVEASEKQRTAALKKTTKLGMQGL